MDIEIEQVLTQIVAFLIMLWILKKFAWKPIFNLMDERQKLIESQFHSIDEQKKDLHQLAEEYQGKLNAINGEAATKLLEAVEKGQEKAEEIERNARNEVAIILNRARAEIHDELAQAREQLKGDIVAMTLTATQKVLQESLDPEKHMKLIEKSIDQGLSPK